MLQVCILFLVLLTLTIVTMLRLAQLETALTLQHISLSQWRRRTGFTYITLTVGLTAIVMSAMVLL